jgi:hypothetical protein
MSAGQYTITIEQGATFSRSCVYKDSGGTPIDITGCTLRMDIREYAQDASALIQLSTGNGRIIITDPVGGAFTLTIAATDTAALHFENAVYDLELEFLSGEVRRLIEGPVAMSFGVTQ